MKVYIDFALIITSIALIASVVLQSKGAGLGGLTGADTGGIFTARRGIEKVLFRVTIGLSVLFFLLAIAANLVDNLAFRINIVDDLGSTDLFRVSSKDNYAFLGIIDRDPHAAFDELAAHVLEQV